VIATSVKAAGVVITTFTEVYLTSIKYPSEVNASSVKLSLYFIDRGFFTSPTVNDITEPPGTITPVNPSVMVII